MKKYRSIFFSCLLLLTACAAPSTQVKPIITSTMAPTKINTLTPSSNLTPTMTPIDVFFVGPHMTFWTKSSIIFAPKASKFANGIEMILERFDITKSLTAEVFICFEMVYGTNDWTLGEDSKLSIGGYDGVYDAKMKDSVLLLDSAQGYIADDQIPPSLTYNWDMRCFKTIFQFDPSAKLITDLAMGIEHSSTFELSIPNLFSDSSARSFDGPWIFTTYLNP